MLLHDFYFCLKYQILNPTHFQSAMRVPYLARFYLYARRHSADEVAVRALCLTEPDRAENPLELREEFRELCRSEFVEVYDVRAVRVLVDRVQDCYAALGVIHTLWRNISTEFDDYIANPKVNG